jgi:hypothetical protein
MPQLSPKERAAHYIERLPESIQGQGGSFAMFKVATTLARGFALDEADVLELLSDWNERHAQPKWSVAELRHKVQDAMQSKLALGYLLDDGGSAAHVPAPRREALPQRVGPSKWDQRRKWPTFKALTLEEQDEIAKLRKVTRHAVLHLSQINAIGSAVVDGHRCFVMYERTFAQARRFDGGMLRTAKGESKAKNLLGSEGAFFGHHWVEKIDKGPVVLVEGVIGHLEALGVLERTDDPEAWIPLAATSAGSRFVRDPGLLEHLAHRRVRIIPDAGEAGLDAAAVWLAELENVGAFADILHVPEGCSDLGDILKSPNQHREFLKAFRSHELIPIG